MPCRRWQPDLPDALPVDGMTGCALRRVGAGHGLVADPEDHDRPSRVDALTSAGRAGRIRVWPLPVGPLTD